MVVQIFYVIVAVVVVSLILFSRHIDHKRMLSVRAFADKLNLSYCRRPEKYVCKRLRQKIDGTDLFGAHRYPTIRNVIEGSVGEIFISMCDYEYITGAGENRRTFQQTIVIADANLPVFVLKPNNFLRRLGDRLVRRNIVFDEATDFSEMYHLSGADEVAVRQRFSPDVLSFFEAHRNFWLESTGDVLLLYKRSTYVPPEEWPEILSVACEAYQRLERQRLVSA